MRNNQREEGQVVGSSGAGQGLNTPVNDNHPMDKGEVFKAEKGASKDLLEPVKYGAVWDSVPVGDQGLVHAGKGIVQPSKTGKVGSSTQKQGSVQGGHLLDKGLFTPRAGFGGAW